MSDAISIESVGDRAMSSNKQLQRTVRDKVPRHMRHHAAAELRRYASASSGERVLLAVAASSSVALRTRVRWCTPRAGGHRGLGRNRRAEQIAALRWQSPRVSREFFVGRARPGTRSGIVKCRSGSR